MLERSASWATARRPGISLGMLVWVLMFGCGADREEWQKVPPAGNASDESARDLAANAVEITALGNEGYLIEGSSGAVLIDALIPEPRWEYEGLAEEVWQTMLEGGSPFDRVILATATHAHEDHVQPAAVQSFLSKRNAVLYSTPQTGRRLEDADLGTGRFETILPDYGEETSIDLEGASVTWLRMQHAQNRADDVQHLAVLIEIDGVRILHLGDAYPVRANFESFDLAEREITVAIVPFWFLETETFPEGPTMIRELIAPQRVIAAHIPIEERSRIETELLADDSDLVFSLDRGETMRVSPESRDP